MKTCTVCGMAKSTGDFFYRNKRAEKLHSQCKQCFVVHRRKTYREHYHKYGDEYRARAIVRKNKIKNNLRSQMLVYLADKSCSECGINDPRVLDFDHIDPARKSFGIARGITNTISWENILLEISKCHILCANCHRIRTSQQQDWYRTKF